MQYFLTKIKVFVASPGDVSEERDRLPNVIQDINAIIDAIAPEKKILLELKRYEKDAYPAMGNGPQDVINKELGEYDIFIGIMWKRFGTPTAVAGSGTEEEFSHAYSKWQQDKNFGLLFYFRQDLASMPCSVTEASQLLKVMEFKEKLSNLGFTSVYKGPQDFADLVRLHLIKHLGDMLATKSNTSSDRDTKQLITESDISVIRQKVNNLKTEYENTRKTMNFGNERTGKMAAIESKMRAMASQISPILPELINSTSPGDRLAAIATLKAISNPAYLPWLANRVGDNETFFVGYNAALALLSAARNLDADYRAEVEAAIMNATTTVNSAKDKDPNQVAVLDNALNEIKSSEVQKIKK